jgi:hypothetical protein
MDELSHSPLPYGERNGGKSRWLARPKWGQEVIGMMAKDKAFEDGRTENDSQRLSIEGSGPPEEGLPMVENLRGILKEAIAAGIAARKARASELVEEARQEGRVKVHSSGWCWIDIDPETCVNAILLCMSGVRVTFRTKSPGFVAEDTRLFLDSVSDYEHFEASWAGIKAAAEVLRRHGIQAEPRGETDKEVVPCQG